jgi:hypothetical protein
LEPGVQHEHNQGAAAPVQPVTPALATTLSVEPLVMRAGEQIWNFTEDEGKIAPGRRRPVLIVDEEVTLLAHTDRRLDMSELHQRVRAAVDEYEVPIEVNLVRARWKSDEKELRERLVASMRDHTFKDIKMIMGLDYMGRWASFQVYLGMEPEAVQLEKKYEIPNDAKYALIGGAIALVMGFLLREVIAVDLFLLVGVGALAYGGFRWYSTTKAHALKRAAETAADIVKREKERSARTYKIDDMRLFCTAMKSVFKRVVDDIVLQGAKVVRVEGGQGGFFSGSGNEPPAPTKRVSDAAQLEV